MTSIEESLAKIQTWSIAEGDVTAILTAIKEARPKDLFVLSGEPLAIIQRGLALIELNKRFVAVVENGRGDEVRKAFGIAAKPT